MSIPAIILQAIIIAIAYHTGRINGINYTMKHIVAALIGKVEDDEEEEK